MGVLGSTGVIIAAAALVLLVILRFPVKIIFKLLINTVAGFAALLLLSFIGGLIGVQIAVNWINALVVGVFGVPGVALILLLQWLSLI